MTSDRAFIRLNGAADLIAAIPAMLGFTPQHCLVVMGLSPRGEHRMIMRADLPTHPRHDASLCRQLLDTARRNSATDLLAVLLSPTGDPLQDTRVDIPGDRLPRPELISTLTAQASSRGLALTHALWAPRIHAGAPYCCYDDHACRGAQHDPACAELTAATVSAGRPVRAARSDITAELAENPITDADSLRALIRKADAHTPADPTAATQHRVDLLRAAVADAVRGNLPDTAERVGELTAALSDHHARDAMCSASAPAAQHLWLHLMRRTPGPDLAEAACLYAMRAYCGGDGVRASEALRRAITANPEHRFALLLATACNLGVPPQRLAAVGSPLFSDDRTNCAPGITHHTGGRARAAGAPSWFRPGGPERPNTAQRHPGTSTGGHARVTLARRDHHPRAARAYRAAPGHRPVEHSPASPAPHRSQVPAAGTRPASNAHRAAARHHRPLVSEGSYAALDASRAPAASLRDELRSPLTRRTRHKAASTQGTDQRRAHRHQFRCTRIAGVTFGKMYLPSSRSLCGDNSGNIFSKIE